MGPPCVRSLLRLLNFKVPYLEHLVAKQLANISMAKIAIHLKP